MMGRLTKRATWLIAPTYAAWQEAKPRFTGDVAPFRRWNRGKVLLYLSMTALGGLILALALIYSVPILDIVGIAYIAAGAYKLVARLLVPRRWADSEPGFVALTSGGMITRAAVLVALIWTLARGQWVSALALGAAFVGLTLTGLVLAGLATRIARRRSSG